MLLVLLLLCAVFSVTTLKRQEPSGAAAAPDVATRIVPLTRGARVLVISGTAANDVAFAKAVADELRWRGVTVLETVHGQPRDARLALERAAARGRIGAIACPQPTAFRAVFDQIPSRFPQLGNPPIVSPQPYSWPVFLNSGNLLNIANQIAVIAIVAIGMTIVIITGGIDLSVGSLIALSAIASTFAIREGLGGTEASTLGMIAGGLIGIGLCGLVGLTTGCLVTYFRIPSFIVTLGSMLIASGLALQISRGQSINQVPQRFGWLGVESDLGIPNSVVLVILLYIAAHVLMSRTTLGRYLYAVGGNAEAARLSGVPVPRVLLFAYTMSGVLAGLAGVVMASQFKSGAPTYGQSYELYTIAAVVVGGTSLSGGEGKIFGTLIGALIIAVIQNGMNLGGIEPYTQKIVLGAVILAAVLVDRLKRRGA
jgi:ribose transport system permease protein